MRGSDFLALSSVAGNNCVLSCETDAASTRGQSDHSQPELEPSRSRLREASKFRNWHTSGSSDTERVRGVMPRLMDALSFFIDAPNLVVRSCG